MVHLYKLYNGATPNGALSGSDFKVCFFYDT